MDFLTNLRESINSFEHEPRKIDTKGDSVLICDMGYIFKYQFAGNPACREDGIPIGGVSGSINLISKLVKKFGSNKVICVFDGKASRKRRRKIIKEYKSNRDDAIGIRSALDLSEEMTKESHKVQYQLLFHLTKFMPVKLIKMDELEADDIIGYLIQKYYKNHSGMRVIVSADKDFHQLVNQRTWCYNPRQDKIISESTVKKDWQTYPENIIFYRVVEGDKSDNLSGISGVGKKTMQKLFPELQTEKYTDIDDFIDLIESKKEDLGKTKTGQKIVDGVDIIRDSYFVMKLSDEMIELDEAHKINSIIDRQKKEQINREKRKLQELIIKYKLDNDIYTKSLFGLFYKLQY